MASLQQVLENAMGLIDPIFYYNDQGEIEMNAEIDRDDFKELIGQSEFRKHPLPIENPFEVSITLLNTAPLKWKISYLVSGEGDYIDKETFEISEPTTWSMLRYFINNILSEEDTDTEEDTDIEEGKEELEYEYDNAWDIL